MAQPQKMTVQRRSNGVGWEARRPGAELASAVAATQKEAYDLARQQIGNAGGGEVAIRGLNGQIREQNTIPPGNDPRRSRG